jgi:hypothetical protein
MPLSNDRKAWWDEETGMVVIYNPNAPNKGTAMMLGDDAEQYFRTLNDGK